MERDKGCLVGGKGIRGVRLEGRESGMSGWRKGDQGCLVGGKGIRDIWLEVGG